MASTLSSWDFSNPIFPRNSNGSSSKTPQTTQIELYGADEETLIRLLRSKIKYALADAGHDEVDQATVSALVERNVLSCGVALHGSFGSTRVLDTDVVRSRVEDLMDGQRGRVNSNEPVLLILVDCEGEVKLKDMRAIKETTLTVMSAFEIFPVRVYVARHPAEKARPKHFREGFSLAVLNVVNTDIGGPGMIQLLDSEAASLDWKRMVVLVEGWNRSTMEWSRDNTIVPQEECNAVPDASSCPVTIPKIGTGESQPESSTKHEENQDEPMGNSVEATDPTKTHESGEEVEDPGVTEHPAMTEWRAQNVDRPAIQHPSWEHSQGSGSLIDLIRMQASGLDHADESNSPQ